MDKNRIKIYAFIIIVCLVVATANLLLYRWVWTNDDIPLWLKIVLSK